MIDKIVDNKEVLITTALEKAKFLSIKNQIVLNAIKICANHLSDKNYQEAYNIEKQASAWYEYRNKIQFLKDFKNKFE